jgi:hypothetical protein
MKEKTIKKIPADHTFLGYSLINLKKGVCNVIGEKKALLVLDKVSGFDNSKGYDIIEVSFEQVLVIMTNYGSHYAFNEIVLNKFLNQLENYRLSDGVKKQVEELRKWKQNNENEYISCCISQ